MGNNRKGKGLTVKQNLFVCEYCTNGGNASAAARVAGYSAKTAFRSGQENMQKPAIVAAIDARGDSLHSRMNQYEITEERILKELALMSFSNIDDYCDEVGNLKPINKLTRDQCAAISEFRIDKEGNHHYKLYDKRSTVDMLAKYKKLYNQDDGDGTDNNVPTVIILPNNNR